MNIQLSITLALVLILSQGLVAQQHHYGLKAGFNYVNSTDALFSNDGNGQYKISYHFGVFGQLELSPKFFLRPELLLSNKGYHFKNQVNSTPQEGNVSLNYINFPLLFSFEMCQGLRVVGGFELGYLLSAKSKYDSENLDIKNAWDNTFDLGLSAGLNYELTEKIQMDVRYIHGIVSGIENLVLTDEYGELIDTDPRFQNRTFQLSIGYQFK